MAPTSGVTGAPYRPKPRRLRLAPRATGRRDVFRRGDALGVHAHVGLSDVLLLTLAAALILLAYTILGAADGALPLTILTVTLGALVAWTLASAREAPFAPVGFLPLYAAMTIIASVMVAAFIGFPGTFLSQDLLTPRLYLVLVLFFLGLLIGCLAPVRRRVGPDVAVWTKPRPITLLAGYAALLLVAGMRVAQLVVNGAGSWNLSRGTDFSLASQFEIVASVLPLVGVALLLLGDHRDRCVVLAPGALIILAVWASAALAIGTRDDVIGPLVMLTWAYHCRVRRLRMRVIACLAVAGLLLFALAGVWRVGGSLATTGEPLAELVRPISSGTNTTALTVHRVPASSPYLYGETYFSSLKYALPAGSLRGQTEDLPAALRFPSLINYTANSGLGFSPIAEAYWNFGLVGAFLVPVLIGSVMRWCYARSRAFAITPIHLLYAVALARVPIALRSDFLQQYKGVLIALALISIVWFFDRIVAGRPVVLDLSSHLNEVNP